MDAHAEITGELKTKVYRCSWSEEEHDSLYGGMDYILALFKDLDPKEDEWLAWDWQDWGGYTLEGGTWINEFHTYSNVRDRIELDNMTIMRVK